MNQTLEAVVVDVTAELLSSLIKKSALAGVNFVRNALREQPTTGASAPRRVAEPTSAEIFDRQLGFSPEAIDRALDEVADPFAAPAACAEDFISCLQRGDHDRACNWCEPELFADDDRRAVLLDTLAAARPVRWTCQLYHHPGDWQAGDPLPWVGVDCDVVFKLDSGAQTMTLIVWIVAFSDGWAVSGLDWGPQRTE